MKVIQPVDTTGYAPFTRASTGTYFDDTGTMQTAPINEARFNWNPQTGVYEGALVEPARTNSILNSNTLVTQSVTLVQGSTYTLSFWGSGTINLSGAYFGPLVGSGSYPSSFPSPTSVRTKLTFTAPGTPPATTTVTLTVTGTITKAQLELGLYATSYIQTAGSPVTRAADVITGTGLFASSFVEATADWSAGTTYNIGDEVRYFPRLYTSLTNANLANTPPTYPTLVNTNWSDIGPDNVFAMFDRQVSTPSVGSTAQEVFAFKIGSDADALALMDIDATNIKAIISNGVATTTSTYITQEASGTLTSAVMSGFTPGTIITVLITNTTVPSIGEVVCGELHTVGNTQYGMSAKIVDYSVKETDEFGVTTFVERPFSKRLTAEVMVDKADFNTVFTLLSELRASPSVWIASDNLDYSDGAVVYGYYRDFTMQVAYFDASLCSIEIEGLI